ncbi:MAG: PrsW family intramembrane metalloprotease [Candidatus Wildermuthbacteria bacterium]|nr:PrsW family intramembrane metalloprotease [Candidatus Wildermuthbacteria bacterium]
MATISPIFLLLLGLVPSAIWLLFYLRKDAHPEPKHMVLRVFLLGMLATFPVIFLEKIVKIIIDCGDLAKFLRLPFSLPSCASPLSSFLPEPLFWILYFVIGVALIEELFKYLAARFGSFSNPNLDEPVDVMIYMIVSALGFAALENMLLITQLLSNTPTPASPSEIVWVVALRFLEATSLHALASGIFGYALAFSLFQRRHHAMFYFLPGLAVATLLHGVFNFYIVSVETVEKENLFPFHILLIFALLAIGLFVSLGFQQLKRIIPTTNNVASSISSNPTLAPRKK